MYAIMYVLIINFKKFMNTELILPISEARKKIFKIAEDVQKPFRRYTLTAKGKPKAVIMSAEEFESWQETLEVMKEFPNLKKDIKQVKKECKSGKYKNYITLENLLEKEGFIIHDKTKDKYGIRRKVKTQRRKRTC